MCDGCVVLVINKYRYYDLARMAVLRRYTTFRSDVIKIDYECSAIMCCNHLYIDWTNVSWYSKLVTFAACRYSFLPVPVYLNVFGLFVTL